MTRFRNLNDDLKPRGLLPFLKWKFNTQGPKRPTWPEFVPLQAKDHPPLKVSNEKIRVSFVGHATFLIQTAALNILTDPVWSHQIGPFSKLGPIRVSPPAISFDALPKIDLVLISHNHYDHMDLPTLKRLYERDNPLFVTPLKNERYLQKINSKMKIKTLNWSDAFQINTDISIHLEPSKHWSRRSLWDYNKALWGNFIVQTPAGFICFIGDSGYDASIYKNIAQKYPNILLSIIPIGAFEPRWFMGSVHMNPKEAFQAYLDLNSKLGLASHFETFQLADDEFLEARQTLEKIKKENKVQDDFIVPSIGQALWISESKFNISSEKSESPS